MGHHHSAVLNPRYPGQSEKPVKFVRAVLKIDAEENDQEVADVLWAFRHLNKSDTGILTFEEYSSVVHREANELMRTIFAFFSSTRQGQEVGVNFTEFLMLFFFFVTMNEQGLVEYVYLLLTNHDYNPFLMPAQDLTHVDTIGNNIYHLLRIHWIGSGGEVVTVSNKANTLHPGEMTSYLGPYKNASHHISHEHFAEGCKHNHALIYPVMALQVDVWDYVFHSIWRHHKGPGNEFIPHIVSIRNMIHKQLGTDLTKRRWSYGEQEEQEENGQERRTGEQGGIERWVGRAPPPPSQSSSASSSSSSQRHPHHPHNSSTLRSSDIYAAQQQNSARPISTSRTSTDIIPLSARSNDSYRYPDAAAADRDSSSSSRHTAGYEHAVRKMKRSPSMEKYMSERDALMMVQHAGDDDAKTTTTTTKAAVQAAENKSQRSDNKVAESKSSPALNHHHHEQRKGEKPV